MLMVPAAVGMRLLHQGAVAGIQLLQRKLSICRQAQDAARRREGLLRRIGLRLLPFPVFDTPLVPAFHIPYSWLETAPLAGTPFLRVIERVVNETRSPLVTEIEENVGTVVQAVFEGVLSDYR